jgi:MoxR-like ATPase
VDILPISTTKPVELPQTAALPKSVHLFDDDSVLAIRTAVASRRPLLIRGEPGTGKSQIARAVAKVWQRLFVSVVVNARTESQDLMWHFDAVARLGEAQASRGEATLEPADYLSPGPLWWVFDYDTAARQYAKCRFRQLEPEKPAGWTSAQGCVLLIDEIDKAEAELPNGLLEILGNGAFSVPYTNQRVGLTSTTPPLVIVTTNAERELPPAFVRRCMVLQLKLPSDEQRLTQLLSERGAYHVRDKKMTNKVMIEAAGMLWVDRGKAQLLGMNPPGQAEYIDLLHALCELKEGEAAQLAMLHKIRKFAFKKYPGLE